MFFSTAVVVGDVDTEDVGLEVAEVVRVVVADEDGVVVGEDVIVVVCEVVTLDVRVVVCTLDTCPNTREGNTWEGKWHTSATWPHMWEGNTRQHGWGNINKMRSDRHTSGNNLKNIHT